VAGAGEQRRCGQAAQPGADNDRVEVSGHPVFSVGDEELIAAKLVAPIYLPAPD
jgi:hypothetical protein